MALVATADDDVLGISVQALAGTAVDGFYRSVFRDNCRLLGIYVSSLSTAATALTPVTNGQSIPAVSLLIALFECLFDPNKILFKPAKLHSG